MHTPDAHNAGKSLASTQCGQPETPSTPRPLPWPGEGGANTLILCPGDALIYDAHESSSTKALSAGEQLVIHDAANGMLIIEGFFAPDIQAHLTLRSPTGAAIRIEDFLAHIGFERSAPIEPELLDPHFLVGFLPFTNGDLLAGVFGPALQPGQCTVHCSMSYDLDPMALTAAAANANSVPLMLVDGEEAAAGVATQNPDYDAPYQAGGPLMLDDILNDTPSVGSQGCALLPPDSPVAITPRALLPLDDELSRHWLDLRLDLLMDFPG